MRTDVKACNCTWGRTDTVRESALKVDWEKNPLLYQGIKPASAACQYDTLLTELHPTPVHNAVIFSLVMFGSVCLGGNISKFDRESLKKWF